MNPLEELHIQIDKEAWDVKQEDLFYKAFLEVNAKLETEGNSDLLHKSEIERQVFAFSKNPEKGLSFKLAGTNTLADGKEIPFEWPDINTWTNVDYEYIRTRFVSCKNRYAKTEYGLVLFYKGKLTNKETLDLLDELFELIRSYLDKAKQNDDKDHYIIYFRIALVNAFHIANYKKAVGDFVGQLKKLCFFALEVHSTWPLDNRSTLRTIIDLTDLAIKYADDFARFGADPPHFLKTNWKAAEVLSKTYRWGAIYVADISLRLCEEIKAPKTDWLKFKAQQYEELANESLKTNNLTAVDFIERALEFYKKLKDEVNIARLEKWYLEIRGKFQLGEIRENLPDDETKRINEIINSEIEKNNEQGIIEIFASTPMFSPLERIKENAELLWKESPLTAWVPKSVVDKWGNTIAAYTSDSEKKEFNFLQAYSFSFQLGEQTLVQLFIRAFQQGKISCNGIIQFLQDKWIAEERIEIYNGHPVRVIPLNVLKPGLKSFFDDMQKLIDGKREGTEFILSADSLTTKIEYLLRIFSFRLGIPTFVDVRQSKSDQIKMEKNLDQLLADLEPNEKQNVGFSLEHYHFFKFILSEKPGRNLRHRVAHGLMDAEEYDLSHTMLIIVLILKLSSYKFK